jgi:hypothetical protein
MESQERDSSNEGHIGVIKKTITDAETLIKAEFDRTEDNSWPECFGSLVTVIYLRVELAGSAGEISEDEKTRLLEKVKNLKAEMRNLMAIYPKKEDEVPDEVKADFLKMLDILS